MKFLSDLKQKDLKEKIALVRIDLNILDEDLSVKNLRVQAVLPTIKFLIKNEAKVVLLSHRGRPRMENGKWQMANGKQLSLKPFAKVFKMLLKQPVELVDFGKTGFKKISADNCVVLAENLRFFEGEEKNDGKFAEQLAGLGDIFVNDAFAVSHRANASVEAITKFIPSYAGLLMEKEMVNLNRAMKNNKHPFVFILGGAKISDKIEMIKNFANKADYFLLGGGIAINCFKAQNLPIGDSIHDDREVEFAKSLLKNKKMILPVDMVISSRKILDVGVETAKQFSGIIKKARIMVWNGPMGLIEDKRFKNGSDALVKAIFSSRAFAVIGGGETATLFEGKKLPKNIFVSTGGGAMLEYLAGKKLPGIEALKH